jgi:purine-binding chemotaxis protein CheW
MENGMSEDSVQDGSGGRFFTVQAGDDLFGLPVTAIHTIFRVESVTAVPFCPREIVGLVNLRGRIVTAVSLRQRLRMPEEAGKRGNLAVGVDYRGESFALIVDGVGDVIDLTDDQRIPAPRHLDPERARLTAQVYRLDKIILPILDMSAVFDFARKGVAA